MIDSFTPATRVRTTVPGNEVVLCTTKGTPNTYQDRYNFSVLDADGEHMETHQGDLMPWAKGWTLTAGQRTALGACTTVAAVLRLVQDYLQAKAEGAIG